MTRRDALRLLVVGTPLVALGALARCAGPALASWKRRRIAGEDYETRPIKGRLVAFQVLAHRGRNVAALEALAAEFDRFVESITGPTSRFGLAPPDREVRLMLFEKREDFERLGGTLLGVILENNGGCYLRATMEIALVFDSRSVEAVYPDIRHEATHLVFDINSGEAGLSPWLSEGLACWHERQAPGGARESKLLPIALRAARSDRRLGLRALLGAGQDVFRQADNERAYAASEAIVSYLLEGAPEDRRRRFVDHVALERRGDARGAAGLERSLGADIESLEADVVDWLSGDR